MSDKVSVEPLKMTDEKSEPKFKVGDTFIHNGDIFTILRIDTNSFGDIRYWNNKFDDDTYYPEKSLLFFIEKGYIRKATKLDKVLK